MGNPHDVALSGDARAIYGGSRLGAATDWETLYADTNDMLAENNYVDQRERLWLLFIHACALWQLQGETAELFERLSQLVLAPPDDLGHELHVGILAYLTFACSHVEGKQLQADTYGMHLRLIACDHKTCVNYLELARRPLQPVTL
jgi:hypothetical protein